MPSRVPLKIFRLKQTTAKVTDNAPTQFLQGVTTNDIFILNGVEEYINAGKTPTGQPLAGNVPTKVQTDSGGKYVTVDGAQKYYIKSQGQFQAVDSSVFEFYVNPQRLEPVYAKLQSEIRTRGGWEIQHWGDALTQLTVTGKSGGMHRYGKNRAMFTRIPEAVVDQTGGLQPNDDITDTQAWQKLIELKKLYDIDHRIRNQEDLTLLGLSIYSSFYVGYFTGFNGPVQDANDPWQFSYSFTMKILQESTVSALAPSLTFAAAQGTTSTSIMQEFGQSLL